MTSTNPHDYSILQRSSLLLIICNTHGSRFYKFEISIVVFVDSQFASLDSSQLVSLPPSLITLRNLFDRPLEINFVYYCQVYELVKNSVLLAIKALLRSQTCTQAFAFVDVRELYHKQNNHTFLYLDLSLHTYSFTLFCHPINQK